MDDTETVCPKCGHDSSRAAAPALPGQYEFSPAQNATIGDLAVKMRFVGLFLILGGVLQCLTVFGGRFEGLGGLIGGFVNMLLGAWTRSAADSFQKIVDTQGRDITHLMGALGDLLRMYRLQYILLIIALVLLAVAVPILLVVLFTR
jgi:hypothetical protein